MLLTVHCVILTQAAYCPRQNERLYVTESHVLVDLCFFIHKELLAEEKLVLSNAQVAFMANVFPWQYYVWLLGHCCLPAMMLPFLEITQGVSQQQAC